ncbi:MAG TPA: UDP-N-acetylmuramoyl-L-alanyl-D-glutamate--2,6-diaminopimelate ligase [Terriglobales bacterium]|nr:UDP-N-acetylmuramoyl-L-alanyl-D-glutamate--2,6-diaminopimelate ligase [Terriglobales bacterium]
MTLDQLLRDVPVLARSGPAPAAVAGLHYDSRRIEPGWAFVAIRGEQADGNAFVPQARRQGATVVLSEQAAPAGELGVAWVQVGQARRALAQAAANFFGRPAERLRLVGITGTNGKTTTAWLVEELLRAAGIRSGLLGTVEYHIGEAVLPSPHTTPESYDLQALLARMVAAECQAAVMEVSSHALAMERVWGCAFEVAVFTNLTQDHLDYHGTMAGYQEAKRRLFRGLGAAAPRAAVVNADDPASVAMLAGYGGEVVRYGLGEGAELRASGLRNRPAGATFTLSGPGGYRAEVATPLVGRANVLNLLAAIGTGWAMGLEREAVVEGASRLRRVPGRFERVYAGQPFVVLVDYAHTPDALANVLGLARELASGEGATPGRVLVLFGCGGDRDRGKRPLMAQAARRGADWVVLTSDNPRSEDPLAIIREALAGVEPGAVLVDADRASAIRLALRTARAGDVVVLAGKGHEAYQIVGEQRLPFDDAQQARAALAELGWSL